MDTYRRLPDFPEGPNYGIIGTHRSAVEFLFQAKAARIYVGRLAAANDFYALMEKHQALWEMFLRAKPKCETPGKPEPHSLTTIVSETWLFPEPAEQKPEIKHIDFYA